MSGARRARFVVPAVVLASAALLGVSRWAGRIAGRGTGAEAPARSGDPAQAGAATGSADLSFYRALGGSGSASGRRGAAAAPAAPEARTLRPAPGDIVAPAGAYVVQVMATRDEEQAGRLRERLARHGYPASIVEDDAQGGTIYRVRIGRWKERGPADAMARTIREKEGLEPWVLQEAEP